MNTQLDTLQQAAAKAVARGDVDALRKALTLGATFASFTIREKTPLAEANFQAWLNAGCPADVRKAGITTMPKAKNDRLEDLAKLTDEEVMACFTLDEGVAAPYFADRVGGYGCPKANFALACAGAKGGGACFDSHLVKRYAAEVEAAGWNPAAGTKTAKRKDGSKQLRADVWNAYASLCAAVYGADSGHGQWSEWLDAFASGCTHSVLVTTILDALEVR